MTRDPELAAALSLLVPGAGQIYNGDVGRALPWLLAAPAVWLASGGLLGWICHVGAAYTAWTRHRT